jgi:hypothetical protein
MPSRAPRKGPRKPEAKPPPIDQELADLAAVIAEHTLDNNAYGWFRTPWRDGWNAVGLARAEGQRTGMMIIGGDVRGWLNTAITERAIDPAIYWIAEEYLSEVLNMNRATRAALRCLQVLIANSSGGGHAYNAILIPAFIDVDPADVADDILEWRCRDSIGTTARLQGDPNDRLRGAFRTAWSRGLYLAAYSLPSATVAGQMRSTARLKEIK